jgi:hypothetical protein
MIQTDINPPILTTTVWEDLSYAQRQAEEQNTIPRQDSSQLTTRSSETDFTHATANSSIRTAPARKSSSSNSLTHSYKKESDLRQQYEQRPEKIPDIAAEMEKWYAMTNRYCIL